MKRTTGGTDTGICSTHCSKSCTASDQCSGQLCCKTKAAQSVWFAFAGGVGGPNPGGSYNDVGPNPGSPVTHDLCQLANEKLASCSSEISWDGQDCDEASTCAAQCIMDASCQEILDVSYYGSYNSFFACLEDCSY